LRRPSSSFTRGLARGPWGLPSAGLAGRASSSCVTTSPWAAPQRAHASRLTLRSRSQDQPLCTTFPDCDPRHRSGTWFGESTPPLRSGTPLATSPLESGLPGFTSPGTFRPWVCDTLRRFTPPDGLPALFHAGATYGVQRTRAVSPDNVRAHGRSSPEGDFPAGTQNHRTAHTTGVVCDRAAGPTVSPTTLLSLTPSRAARAAASLTWVAASRNPGRRAQRLTARVRARPSRGACSSSRPHPTALRSETRPCNQVRKPNYSTAPSLLLTAT